MRFLYTLIMHTLPELGLFGANIEGYGRNITVIDALQLLLLVFVVTVATARLQPV